MKALLIGGTKFIGPYVLAELYNRGYKVTLFHRGQSQISTPHGVTEILGDRNEIGLYKAQLKELAPDIVIDMIPMTEADVKSIATLFRGIAKRVIVISSMDVYLAHGRFTRYEPGLPVTLPLVETSFLRKKYYENYDKLLVEKTYRTQRPKATILRLPFVYGPGDYQHRLYPYLKRMDDDRPYILLDKDQADWKCARAYVKDVALAIGLATENEAAAGEIYNVAESSCYSELEWAKKIAECVGWKGKFISLPKRHLPAHLITNYNYKQSLMADTGKLRRELGFKEIDALETRLMETIAWERKHPPEGVQFDYAAEDACIKC